jgi:uncharacterized membrane protein YfcA
MTELLTPHVLIIGLVFFFAGGIKGVTGMGLPTVSMALLGAMMPPVAAAALLIIPSFVTNVWQLLMGPSFTRLIARLWLMMLGVTIGTIGGSWLLTNDTGGWTTMGLGIALMVYAAFSLFAWQLAVSPQWERWLSPWIGVSTGIVTGGTGVFVIPAGPYLQSLGLDREDLIQALGLSFTVSTIALAIGLAGGGAFRLGEVGASMLAIAPSLAGLWAGQKIRQRVSAATFRRWFLICLFFLGLQLLLRPLL